MAKDIPVYLHPKLVKAIDDMLTKEVTKYFDIETRDQLIAKVMIAFIVNYRKKRDKFDQAVVGLKALEKELLVKA